MSSSDSSQSWSKSRLAIRWVEGFQIQGQAPVQEDTFEINPERGIFILADGFGGSRGREASELVVQSMKQFLEQEAGDLDATLPFELRAYYSLAGNVLFNAVSFANHKLMQVNKGGNALENGGASLIAGYLEGNLLALANVGACSVYLARNGKIKEVVTPKTLSRQTNPFDDEVKDGEAEVPLMSFGTVRQLEPEVIEVELKPGDRLIFQSSGVSAELRNRLFELNNQQELSQIVDSHASRSAPLANCSVICLSF